MGKNDWNSLWGQVKWQRSYASSEVVPLIRRYCFAACVPLNPAKHALEAPTRFHPFAMALKRALTQSNKAVQISACVGLTGCFPNTVRCTESTKRTRNGSPND
jgi:hypothetical protein